VAYKWVTWVDVWQWYKLYDDICQPTLQMYYYYHDINGYMPAVPLDVLSCLLPPAHIKVCIRPCISVSRS